MGILACGGISLLCAQDGLEFSIQQQRMIHKLYKSPETCEYFKQHKLTTLFNTFCRDGKIWITPQAPHLANAVGEELSRACSVLSSGAPKIVTEQISALSKIVATGQAYIVIQAVEEPIRQAAQQAANRVNEHNRNSLMAQTTHMASHGDPAIREQVFNPFRENAYQAQVSPSFTEDPSTTTLLSQKVTSDTMLSLGGTKAFEDQCTYVDLSHVASAKQKFGGECGLAGKCGRGNEQTSV